MWLKIKKIFYITYAGYKCYFQMKKNEDWEQKEMSGVFGKLIFADEILHNIDLKKKPKKRLLHLLYYYNIFNRI